MTEFSLKDYKHPEIHAGDIIDLKQYAVMNRGVVIGHKPTGIGEVPLLVLSLNKEKIDGAWKEFTVMELDTGNTRLINIFQHDIVEVLA
jgi:hypothetical protein